MRKTSNILILLTLVMSWLPFQTAKANDAPVLIEIFTYAGSSGAGCGPVEEDESHNADGTHKEGISEDHDAGNGVPKQNVESVLSKLITENPNIIALNYLHQEQPHEHDENGNDTITQPIEINQTLNTFIQDRNYLYYKQSNFLDQFTNFQMVIGGTYKTQGTMKHIADAAIKRYRSEQTPEHIKLAIKGQNIEIELPKSISDKAIPLTLIGYKKSSANGITQQDNPTNVVTHFKTLNEWDGKARQETISIAEMNADGFVLLAQDQDTGKIYAAGKAEKQQ